MYLEEYKRWLAADLEDADLNPELARIEGNDEEIKDRFAVSLKFGTAGLRGVLGAGTNRMNIYVVRQATQGLANWVKTQGGNQTVAISYDSRFRAVDLVDADDNGQIQLESLPRSGIQRHARMPPTSTVPC